MPHSETLSLLPVLYLLLILVSLSLFWALCRGGLGLRQTSNEAVNKVLQIKLCRASAAMKRGCSPALCLGNDPKPLIHSFNLHHLKLICFGFILFSLEVIILVLKTQQPAQPVFQNYNAVDVYIFSIL